MAFILFLLFLLLLISLYLIFILIKWILGTSERRIWGVRILGFLATIFIVNLLFFSNTKFIQSKVYNSMILVKRNPLHGQATFFAEIKEKCIQKVKEDFRRKKSGHMTDFQDVANCHYSIEFYKYYKGFGMNPFGEAGTAHFIEHKEDPGGFSSELLEYYDNYKIAEFNIEFCENDYQKLKSELRFFSNNEEIKPEIFIINVNTN